MERPEQVLILKQGVLVWASEKRKRLLSGKGEKHHEMGIL